MFFIPSGTIHAICSGILICEIQQNSNTTYRVYDYDRRGKDGKPRELHIEKAVEVSNLYPAPKQKKYADNKLAECKYFTVEKISCNGTIDILTDTESFRCLTILDGCGMLDFSGASISIRKGESIFIPAYDGKIILQGDIDAVLSYV